MMRTELEALLLYAAPRELLIAEPLSSATSKMLGAFVSASAGVRAETVQRDVYRNGGAQAAVVAFYGEDGAAQGKDCGRHNRLSTVGGGHRRLCHSMDDAEAK